MQKEKENEKKLKDLRNHAVFGFLMLSALFVFFIFVLELHSDDIEWLPGVKEDSTDEVCTLYINSDVRSKSNRPININY